MSYWETRSAYHLYGKLSNSGKNANGMCHAGGMILKKKAMPCEVSPCHLRYYPNPCKPACKSSFIILCKNIHQKFHLPTMNETSLV